MATECVPKISVLISVRNEGQYIDAAISSILCQTYKGFELLILDDASTDNTASRINVWAARDSRISTWTREKNRGKGENINFLLEKARGAYIALMDGDDIALPNRFEVQLAVLETGSADICGGSVVTFGIGPCKLLRSPMSDCEIRTFLLFDVALLNSAVLMRREVMEVFEHRQNYAPAMDYDFYLRAAKQFRMYNVPDVLLARRLHPGQISDAQFVEQVERRRQLSLRALADRGLAPTLTEHALHLSLVNPPGNNHLTRSRSAPELADVIGTMNWIAKLLLAAPTDSCYRSFIVREWYQYCLRHTSLGFVTFRAFCGGSHRFGASAPRRQRAILFVLSVMRMKYQSIVYEWLRLATPSARISRRIVRHTLSYVRYMERIAHESGPKGIRTEAIH